MIALMYAILLLETDNLKTYFTTTAATATATPTTSISFIPGL